MYRVRIIKLRKLKTVGRPIPVSQEVQKVLRCVRLLEADLNSKQLVGQQEGFSGSAFRLRKVLREGSIHELAPMLCQ